MIEDTVTKLRNRCLINNKIILVRNGIHRGYVNDSFYESS